MAAILNKKYVGNSGYFARKLSLITSDTMLDENKRYDCRTNRPIVYEIKNEKYLQIIDGRYYTFSPDDIIEKRVDIELDRDLVGKTILLRSPTSCAGHVHGHGICYKCYGDLAYTNNDIHIGQFSSQNLTAPLTQRILSSKHLLTTNSEKLEWSEGFDEFFIVEGNIIQVNPTINTNSYSIVIDLEDVEVENEMDEIEFNHTISYFKIIKNAKRGGKSVICEIREKNDNKLYLSTNVDIALKKHRTVGNNEVEIPLSKFDLETPIFYLNIVNNELSKPLKSIIKLIDNKNNMTIDELIQTFARLLIESEIGIQLVHAECIVRNIIRSDSNILNYPNYTNPQVEYQILTVSAALKHNPSVVISMSFERLKEQLHNALTYKKSGTSFLDTLYLE